MSGSAPAADSSGNIFFLEGNGDFDTALNAQGFPSNANCGNCFVKISIGAGLKLVIILLHTIPFLNRAPTWISALAARFSCRTFKTRGPHEAPHRRRR